jgi:hypothetical protein
MVDGASSSRRSHLLTSLCVCVSMCMLVSLCMILCACEENPYLMYVCAYAWHSSITTSLQTPLSTYIQNACI